MPLVDVVVVSFNSRDELRACVSPLAAVEDINVIVVDNDSDDESPRVVSDLPISVIELEENKGFSHGCNVGWRSAHAPYVLFLNPDARLEESSLRRLILILEQHPDIGVVGPKLVHEDGALHFSQRRFPRLLSTFSDALFLHRLFPRWRWTHEVIHDKRAYGRLQSPEWISGACMLVRRSVLEEVGGFDEGLFLSCEDDDLCRRVWQAGHSVAYEPAARAIHVGGASAPRAKLLPVVAASQLRYARKYHGRTIALFFRFGIGLGALTHLLVSRGGAPARAGYARTFALVARPWIVPPSQPHA
jgi:N-acetylglucosaminyl-diphospho-decaprenol L-rhamnosyltransferase